MELHFTEKKKILFGIPKSLVKDKARHVEGSTHGKWGECPLFQGQYSFSAIRVVSSAYLVIDIPPGNLDSSLCFVQPSISHDVLCI